MFGRGFESLRLHNLKRVILETKIISRTIESGDINGKNFYYCFLAGAKKVLESQQHLNSINVFPVKDGDTGTNLASTLKSIIDTIIPTTGVKEAAAAVADAALIGARGNSGIIFAQFLYGFSNRLETSESKTIDFKLFVEMASSGVKHAYQAISNPVEGTIITVMREWSEFLESVKNTTKGFVEIFIESYHKAEQSLAETPDKLEILAKNKVVDSGAKGFVLFLGGVVDLLKSGNLRDITYSRNVVKEIFVDEVIDSHEDITFRYCTEGLVSGENIDKNEIRERLSGLGDSLVVAGSKNKIRIHIHTDTPVDVFKYLGQIGSITYQKADDMVMQQEVIERKKAKIAIVTDSTCDLPQSFIDEHQINVLPLSVHFDDSYFLDKVTIDYPQFKKLFDNAKNLPTTAQPAYKDFANKYAYLATHYDSIIAINVTSAMSGTSSTSRKAAKSISQQTRKKITVFDSKAISANLGLIVWRATELIESGATHEEVCKAIELWIKEKNNMVVCGTTTKYMVRSGRLSPSKGLLAKILNLKPAVYIDYEGKAVKIGSPFSNEAAIKMIENRAIKDIGDKKIWGYSITHVSNESGVEEIKRFMSELTGGMQPLFIEPCTPVIATNVGPGTLALGFMLE